MVGFTFSEQSYAKFAFVQVGTLAGVHDRGTRAPRDKDSLSRVERKEATRRAIVAAALTLLEEQSFSALSLREVTREAGIAPTAFYRHFESMEALGLVLIDESFRTLRDMLRGARAGKLDPRRVIDSSVDILITGVNERREHWRFISRERSSGVTVLRYAIRTEIRLITSELAIDLARFPGLRELEQRGPQHPGQPVRQRDDLDRRDTRGRRRSGRHRGESVRPPSSSCG